MNYCSTINSHFINPLYNPIGISKIVVENLIKDSVSKIDEANNYNTSIIEAHIDSNGQYVYIEEKSLTTKHQLAIETSYPIHVDSNNISSAKQISYLNLNPDLCTRKFIYSTTRNGDLKKTINWNPSQNEPKLLMTYHCFAGDFKIKKRTECHQMQTPFFNDPITFLPGNFIYQCINRNQMICAHNSYCKVIRIDTCQSADSAFYFAHYTHSGNVLFHCLLKFKYPYYTIIQFRTERAEQKSLSIMDMALIDFDGRPLAYTMYSKITKMIIVKTDWFYSNDANVLKIESTQLASQGWLTSKRLYYYTHFNK